MTPERVTLRVSLALVAASVVGLLLLRPGTRLSAWLDAIDPCPDLAIGDDL